MAETKKKSLSPKILMRIAQASSFIAHIAEADASSVGLSRDEERFDIIWDASCGATILMTSFANNMLAVIMTHGPDTPRALRIALHAFCKDHDIIFRYDGPDGNITD